MRCLIYARYSTTLQSSLSIDDQLRVCRDRITAEGWQDVGAHVDAAISGAVRERPGLNALLAEVAAGRADIVIAEAIDRLSRDQEDIAGIFKLVAYAGARIFTLSEGDVGELHIGLRGTMAAMTRKDIADKVRRGLSGRALAGSNPGGMAYGYSRVAKLDARGELVRGLRVIDEDQADVIRRIFADYVGGMSARAIAVRLNAEGVRGPSGGLWRASSINGCPRRLNGILQNHLYRGRQIYNRTHRVYHPVTRRREIRLNPESAWLVKDIPELRIVDEATWSAAAGMRAALGSPVISRSRRPKAMLSGLAHCAICGSQWRIIGQGRWGCGAHHDGRACANGRSITRESFERRVLAGLTTRMLTPELADEYIAAWRAARVERLSSAGKARAGLERRRGAVAGRINRLVGALADPALGGMAELVDALAAARAEREAIDRDLGEVAAEKVVALHPGLAADYRRRVERLTSTLAEGGDGAAAARGAIRALIHRIDVAPHPTGRGVAIEVQGRLTTLLELADDRLAPMYVNGGAPGTARPLAYILRAAV